MKKYSEIFKSFRATQDDRKPNTSLNVENNLPNKISFFEYSLVMDRVSGSWISDTSPSLKSEGRRILKITRKNNYVIIL